MGDYAYFKQWREKNKESNVQYHKEYYKKNIERLKEQYKTYVKTDKAKELRILRRKSTKGRKISEAMKQKRVNTKKVVFSHYGMSCQCCKESNIGFLTIDHINNDGHKNTGENGTVRLKSHSLYMWIIKNNFPNDLRLLCFNCNIGRRNNGGACPHSS